MERKEKGEERKRKGEKKREKRKIKEKGNKKISPATHTWNLLRGREFNSIFFGGERNQTLVRIYSPEKSDKHHIYYFGMSTHLFA